MHAILSAVFGLLAVLEARYGSNAVSAGALSALAISNAIIHHAERRS